MKGSNFLIRREGKLRKYGFYQNILIAAEDENRAEILAAEKIKNNDELMQLVQNHENDPPIISLQTISEIDSFDNAFKVNSKRLFYIEKRWWQFWK